ncbi:MAG: hypothetical protein SVY15_08195 [Halobacteriota archaeon]|nr:hypothetical protein [Halobacteriota archaeon]
MLDLIFPSHCKNVAVSSPSHPPLKGKTVYFLTEYILYVEGSSTSVYQVETDGRGLFREVISIGKIASEDETVSYDEEVDLSDRALLIEIASELCYDGITTVVFTGIDKHVTFVHKPDIDVIKTVLIFDVIPPEPPWLLYTMNRLNDIGLFGELELRFTSDVLDLRHFEDPESRVIFPCYTSGLKGDFLDSIGEIPDEEYFKLVGCEISKRILEEKFSVNDYDFMNICPLKRKYELPFIVRCCRSEDAGLKKIDGIQGVAVHWGATPLEIVDAVKLLASKL